MTPPIPEQVAVDARADSALRAAANALYDAGVAAMPAGLNETESHQAAMSAAVGALILEGLPRLEGDERNMLRAVGLGIGSVFSQLGEPLGSRCAATLLEGIEAAMALGPTKAPPRLDA